MQKPIYLDYAATTPVDPRVMDEMLPWFTEKFGNAASTTHNYGKESQEVIENVKSEISKLINANPDDIIFTSGTTESINIAIKGIFEANRDKGDHIITVKTEHKAVLDTCKYLEYSGAKVTYLSVDENGLIDLKQLEDSITDKTILISVMYVNNETGVIQPIRDIVQIAHKTGAYFLTDATQAFGKIPIDVSSINIDLMTFSAHKIYGPKGIGALYVKEKFPKIKVNPIIHGGGHQYGLRSGTMNVPGIVGLGMACKICHEKMAEELSKIKKLRDLLESEIMKMDNVSINGIYAPRLPTISNIYFKGIESKEFTHLVQDKLAVSTGSACTSADQRSSHVLIAMFNDEYKADSSLRFSFGRFTTIEEIENSIKIVNNKITQLREKGRSFALKT